MKNVLQGAWKHYILNTSRQEYCLVNAKINVLGLIFDSVNMLLSVIDDKKEKIQNSCSCNSYLEEEPLKIRELASLIETLMLDLILLYRETSQIPRTIEHWINAKHTHWKNQRVKLSKDALEWIKMVER